MVRCGTCNCGASEVNETSVREKKLGHKCWISSGFDIHRGEDMYNVSPTPSSKCCSL